MDTFNNLIYIYSKKDSVYELMFDLIYFNGTNISSSLLKDDDLSKFKKLIKEDTFQFKSDKSYHELSSNDIAFDMQYYLSKAFTNNEMDYQFGGSVAIFDDKTKFDRIKFDKLMDMDYKTKKMDQKIDQKMDQIIENLTEVYVNKTYKYIFYLEYDAEILKKLDIDMEIISSKDKILECFTKFKDESDLMSKIGKITSLELFKENYGKIKKIHKEQAEYKAKFRENRLIIENYKNSDLYMLNITISKDNNIIIDRDFEFETENDCKLYGKIAYIIYNLINKGSK